MVEEKVFFLIQSINIVYPNVVNMILVAITRKKEIFLSFQVYLIPRMNINYKENDGNKAFLGNPKH